MSATAELKMRQKDYLDKAEKANDMLANEDLPEEEYEAFATEAEQWFNRAKGLQPAIDRSEEMDRAREKGEEVPPSGGSRELQADDDDDNDDEVFDAPVKVRIPATARRHRCRSFRNEVVHGMDAEHRAYAFGRYMLAVAARTNPGRFGHFHNLIGSHEDSFGPMNAATEGGNAGIYVPEQFGTDIIILAERYGISRTLFNNLPMTSDTRTDPKEGSDPAPVFVGEGVEGTDVTPTDDNQVMLTAKKLMAILIFSSELNEDAVISFGDAMITRMARGFAKKEDQCCFNGDGTSTFGGMVGVRTKLADFDGAGTDSVGLIDATGTTWAAMTLTDFEQVVAKLPDFEEGGEEDNPSAVWVCHRAFFFEVMQRLALASGGVTAEETQAGTRRRVFLGYPVRFSNVFPKVTATTGVMATFGNHEMAANFGDRRQYSVDFSTEATIGSVNLFSTDQLAIKGHERFAFTCHSVGDATDAGPVCGIATG